MSDKAVGLRTLSNQSELSLLSEQTPPSNANNDASDTRRENTRQVFFKAWALKKRGQPLQALERQIVTLIEQHPEYHAFFDNENNIDHDFSGDKGVVNPFLHLGMHLAIGDQLALEQPPGIREIYQQLAQQFNDVHEAEHHIMNCLAYWMGQPQTAGDDLDYAPYLSCLRKVLKPS